MRHMPIIGGYGYIPMGPLLISSDRELATIIVESLRVVAKDNRIHYLVIQPPLGAESLRDHLKDCGFVPTLVNVAPAATLLINLTRSHDEILAGMKSKTRQSLRCSERSGLTVRQGVEADISAFHSLLVASGERHGFAPLPETYYREVWRSLHFRGLIQLFLSEFHEEVVTALLVICFGESITEWRVGWSGRHGDLHPNEMVRWQAIKWAKSHGYRFYDMGGIHRKVADCLACGKALPVPMAVPNHFKIKFGGKLAVCPPACAFFYSSFLRWVEPNLPDKSAL